MGRQYEQLSLDDRCEIARLQANGRSVRQIAAALDRPPSTLSRELKRNSGRQVGYKPSYAQEQTRARRWKGSRLEREESLRQAVLERLTLGWSPEQIAGRLALEAGRRVISYESIYRFVYLQIARHKDYRWRRYLPRAKSRRGCRGRKSGSSTSFIEARIPLSERPADAADRKTPGHWEADLMLFSKYGQAVLTAQERQSRRHGGGVMPRDAALRVAPQHEGRSRGRYTSSMPSRSAIASALRHLAPRLPAHEFAAVVDHALDSPGLRVASPENAAWLSLVAYARHTLTDYDALLAQDYDRDSARFFVANELARLLGGWGVKRKLGEGE